MARPKSEDHPDRVERTQDVSGRDGHAHGASHDIRARSMFAASTVPIAPNPTPSEEGQRSEPCYLSRNGMQPPRPVLIALLSLIHLDGNSQSGGTMYVTHDTGLEIENARVALMLITLGITVFWRLILRVLLAVAVVAGGTGLSFSFTACTRYPWKLCRSAVLATRADRRSADLICIARRHALGARPLPARRSRLPTGQNEETLGSRPGCPEPRGTVPRNLSTEALGDGSIATAEFVRR